MKIKYRELFYLQWSYIALVAVIFVEGVVQYSTLQNSANVEKIILLQSNKRTTMSF